MSRPVRPYVSAPAAVGDLCVIQRVKDGPVVPAEVMRASKRDGRILRARFADGSEVKWQAGDVDRWFASALVDAVNDHRAEVMAMPGWESLQAARDALFPLIGVEGYKEYLRRKRGV